MRTILWLHEPGGPDLRPHADLGLPGAVDREVRARAARRVGRGEWRVVGRPERELTEGGGTLEDYLRARERGVRSFVLWADAGRREVLARVVTTDAARHRQARYEVLSGTGERLAVVTRRPARWGRRVRWSVWQTGRPAPAVGRKGRLGWWVVGWILLPFSSALVFLTFLQFEGVMSPRRTRLRVDGEVVLDYLTSPGSEQRFDALEVCADWWDPRVAAAVLLLFRSHVNRLHGVGWDDAVTR
ncbi:hypothetical protein [Streptomyces specialis]|uniref:hypothetical protein n=1 Tax=Streptomyces specialis TaxID=498367 RepID=UPI000A424542|nr:hypothetical protein [Streptomyces specialis]